MFVEWCEEGGLKYGGLEGVKSLKYWPQIVSHYSIPLNDSSMNNLLYMSIFANKQYKDIFYNVLTDTRQLTNFCQLSVRPILSISSIKTSFAPEILLSSLLNFFIKYFSLNLIKLNMVSFLLKNFEQDHRKVL